LGVAFADFQVPICRVVVRVRCRRAMGGLLTGLVQPARTGGDEVGKSNLLGLVVFV